MKVIFKDYITHTSVQFLFLALFISLAAISELAVWEHWPWLVLVVVSAPFYEWITHKFVLHGALSPMPGRWRDYQIRLHHGHHLDPANRTLQFAPASAILIMMVQLYLFYALVCWSITVALVPLAGSIAYYLFYEWVHLAHHTPAYRPRTRMGMALRDAHMRHHFHNENYNWGITNALGDMILGTWKHLDEIPKSTTARHLDNFNPQNRNSGM